MGDQARGFCLVKGIEMDIDGLKLAAERVITLERMYNARLGFSRKDDALPDRIIKHPLPDGPNKGKIIGQEAFDRMISDYYSLRGWDEDGRPTAATLELLGITQGEGGMLVNFRDQSLAVTGVVR